MTVYLVTGNSVTGYLVTGYPVTGYHVAGRPVIVLLVTLRLTGNRVPTNWFIIYRLSSDRLSSD